VAGRRDQRVRQAVVRAENTTGLQFCVYLGGTGDEDPRALAERLFGDTHPAVLLVVAPDARRVEILTDPAARERIPDAACAAAIERMRPALRHRHFDRALVAAIDHLAEVAGPGADTGRELPDVVDERD
jgi:uncharacterized membrane protein YgcG